VERRAFFGLRRSRLDVLATAGDLRFVSFCRACSRSGEVECVEDTVEVEGRRSVGRKDGSCSNVVGEDLDGPGDFD